MAYVNFSEIDGGVDRPRHLYGEAPAAHRTGFTALEWQVIALAQIDGIGSLQSPSRITLALDSVFGTKRINPELANPTLEILRRVAVLAWHRGFALPQSQVDAFYEAGYSEEQLETLLASVGAGRVAAQRKAF